MLSKRCTRCNAYKARTAFHKNKRARDGLNNVCKTCQAKYTREWKYGLRPGQIEEMIKTQGGRCAICQRKDAALRVDHCHKTDRVRAMLCHHCNIMIGMCDDNISVLARAIQYLQEHAL